jgi:hypothetical protein
LAVAAQRESKVENLVIVTRDEIKGAARSAIPDSISVQPLAEFLGLYGER